MCYDFIRQNREVSCNTRGENLNRINKGGRVCVTGDKT
jgi:hypothetical protein